MLGHTKMVIEQGHVSINLKHDILVTSLRTAVEREGILDKAATSYNDILDALEWL